MKTSFISSMSVQTTMRNSIASAQRDLVDANTEAVSGRYADIGAQLGASTSRALDLTRDISRIDSLYSTAALATQRLDSAELSLSNINDLTTEMQNAILTLGGTSDETSLSTARTTMSSALDAFTGFVNTAVNGEYIFSGINTDVKPMNDLLSDDSKAKKAFDDELNWYIADKGIGSKEAMTADDMTDFLADMEEKFNGTKLMEAPENVDDNGDPVDFWSTYVSNATDENMKSRISPTEVVDTSTNANSKGMRYFALSAMVATTFMQTGMSNEARGVVAEQTRSYISQASSGINQQRTTIGVATERVSKAEESLQAQKDILTTHLGSLENVDAAEAATRVNTLQTLLETAYSVTAKIQNLSLVNYL
ncbi:flagellar hook-associated family protein [Neorhizobium alkalisoli]|uniref:Flagellin n=1 Tax=Neorhizobium alkalisoli TaxID=528178 RepID=A0A561QSM4_9HYPH|nr:flagellar hook-associated family protein [Neorhizobium alkalisoli]TWF53378.1 flagellar hook-associated protein 3 FlgL [Neorhizobium alkalisoli]